MLCFKHSLNLSWKTGAMFKVCSKYECQGTVGGSGSTGSGPCLSDVQAIMGKEKLPVTTARGGLVCMA